MTFQDLICQTKTSSVQNSLPQKKRVSIHPYATSRIICSKNISAKKVRVSIHPNATSRIIRSKTIAEKKTCFHPSIRHIKDWRGKRRLAGKVKTTVLCGESPNVPLGDFPFQLSVTVMNPCHEAKGDFPKAKSR